ncbi:MAG TPA: Calx-beta domain-containing protein, partial [Novosphingobium sp.]|nr:Calx-beta domain-containing protein [Novosphingobium sp.]
GVVGTATIINDDKASGLPSVSVESSTAVEGEYLGIVVRLDAPSTASVTVMYRIMTGGGLGTIPTDQLYSFDQGEIFMLTFAPGETSKTITPYIPSDSLDEIDAFYTLELFDPTNAELAGGATVLRTMGVALDNDGAGSNLAVFVGSPILVEGNSGTSVARFEVRLSAPAASDITLNYATSDGSATAGSDYTAKSGTVTILAGQTSAYVDVNVAGDTAREGVESFFLRVTPPAAAPNAAGVVGTATILNDDTATGLPSISIESSIALETEYTGFTLRLDKPSATTVTASLRFFTGNGYGTFSSAELGSSVNAGQTFTVTFAPGETTKNFYHYTNGDSTDEIDENYTLELFSVTNAEMAGGVSLLRASGIALDDDGAGDNIALAGHATGRMELVDGTVDIQFEVRLSRPAANAVTVNYTTANGSAIAGQDFTAVSGSLTFQPGETVKIVTVKALPDQVLEGNEDFFLTVTPVTVGVGPAGLNIAGTIIDLQG